MVEICADQTVLAFECTSMPATISRYDPTLGYANCTGHPAVSLSFISKQLQNESSERETPKQSTANHRR